MSIWLSLLVLVVASGATAVNGQVVHSSDFEGSTASSEWSKRTIATTPAGGRRFLGRFSQETVTLTLLGLPEHSAATVKFDLFIIQSWDGNSPEWGPDVFTLSIPGKRTLIHTSFANSENFLQSYPGSYPPGSFQRGTGAAERSTLGYPFIEAYNGLRDSVYRLEFTFAHSESSLVLAFAGSLGEALSNESWGVDNVSVEVSSPAEGIVEGIAPVFTSEASTEVQFELRRSGATNLPTSLNFSTEHGLANDDDYVASMGSIEFAANETVKYITIPIRNDAISEVRDETFGVRLTTTNANLALGEPSPLLAWIFDDDSLNPHYSKLISSPISQEGGASLSASWGDYDGDGLLDLFVGNFSGHRNFLYRNRGEGSFEKITTGLLATDIGETQGSAWADYDNDGDLDLLMANYTSSTLYRNNGTGNFTRVPIGTAGPPYSTGCAWGDYDNDGNVDLFIMTDAGGNLLFRNNGNGSFTRITTGSIVTDGSSAVTCGWADYDNDGFLDLFVGSRNGGANFLYHNNGNGTFTRVTTGPIATDRGNCYGSAWGDYDNDGFVDLVVLNFGVGPSFLYRNNRNGTFTKVASGPGQTTDDALGCAWADVDNDGDLDLFVASFGPNSSLYVNNGNGTFTRRVALYVTREYNPSVAVAFGDYDRDGDADLFIGRYLQLNNGLYVNEGNTNNYITVRLRGTLSNASGIGAKVQIQTVQGDRELTQVREISGGNGINQGPLEAHFGMGKAASANLSVRWPSGAVQTWTNISANQTITISESPQISAMVPAGTLAVSAKVGASILLERSGDLENWSTLVETNVSSSVFTYRDSNPAASHQFYRSRYLKP